LGAERALVLGGLAAHGKSPKTPLTRLSRIRSAVFATADGIVVTYLLVSVPVTRRYILSKSLIGAFKGVGKVTTLPPGSIVEITAMPLSAGMVDVLWKGQWMTLFSQDIETGSKLEQNGHTG
jgi:hypothetical protein